MMMQNCSIFTWEAIMSDVNKLLEDIKSKIIDAGPRLDGVPSTSRAVTSPARPALQDRAIAVVEYGNPDRTYPFTTF
jgi:hypothetical protein